MNLRKLASTSFRLKGQVEENYKNANFSVLVRLWRTIEPSLARARMVSREIKFTGLSSFLATSRV